MKTHCIRIVAALNLTVAATAPLAAQARPDFSGVWRLVPAESQMIGGGGFSFRCTTDGEECVNELTSLRVFQKLGPHPSQRPPPDSLPSVPLPPELDRVLREYERHWREGNTEALVALFTEDGMVARRGGWIRGQAGLRDALQNTSGDLRLRAVAYALEESVGYVIGAYGYGDQPGIPDRGMFILALRRGEDGRWLVEADLDGAIRPVPPPSDLP